MNSERTPIDSYFSGGSTAAEESQLAQQLTDNPSLADQFAEQARLDAMLGDLFQDRKAGALHANMLAQLQPAVPEVVAQPKRKVVRGPFQPFKYGKQVAAVLVGALLLWGVAGIWRGAVQITDRSARQKCLPNVETSVAAAGSAPAAANTEDRALEAWLGDYYVDAQPAVSQPLRAWMNNLVAHEFPLHNHLNKHQQLTWELRVKDPQIKAAIEEKLLHLQCGASSLLAQAQGVAALAECEVTVEKEKLVLTPMTESNKGLETKQLTFNEAFAKGTGPVGSAVAANWSRPTMDDNADYVIDLTLAPEVHEFNGFINYSPENQLRQRIMGMPIDWPVDSGVAEVAAVAQQPPAVFFGSYLRMTDGNGRIMGSPDNTQWMERSFDAGNGNLPALAVVAQTYQAKVTATPKGLRQLEILSRLNPASSVQSSFQVTDYIFPVDQAPQEKDRVMQGKEAQELIASWQKDGHAQVVAVHPQSPAPNAIPTPHLWAVEPADVVPEIATESEVRLGQKVLGMETAVEESAPPFEPGVPSPRYLLHLPSIQSPPASNAALNLQRSGEALRVSGEINLSASPPPVILGKRIAQNVTTWEFRLPETDVDGEKLLVEKEPAQLPAAEAHPAIGVDVSLTLFKGQRALVRGPDTGGKAHFYLLSWD